MFHGMPFWQGFLAYKHVFFIVIHIHVSRRGNQERLSKRKERQQIERDQHGGVDNAHIEGNAEDHCDASLN
jgi:hypothetical protein